MSAGDLEGRKKKQDWPSRLFTRPMAGPIGAIRVLKSYAEAAEFLSTALRLNPSLVGARYPGKSTPSRKKGSCARIIGEVLRVDPDNARRALARHSSRVRAAIQYFFEESNNLFFATPPFP